MPVTVRPQEVGRRPQETAIVGHLQGGKDEAEVVQGPPGADQRALSPAWHQDGFLGVKTLG